MLLFPFSLHPRAVSTLSLCLSFPLPKRSLLLLLVQPLLHSSSPLRLSLHAIPFTICPLCFAALLPPTSHHAWPLFPLPLSVSQQKQQVHPGDYRRHRRHRRDPLDTFHLRYADRSNPYCKHMPRAMTISSAANPLVKDVRRALQHGGLTPQGWCVAGLSTCWKRPFTMPRCGRSWPPTRRRRRGRAASPIPGDSSGAFARPPIPDGLRHRDQPGRGGAGVAAPVELRGSLPQSRSGGGARRAAGSRKRRRHRTRLRSLRRDRGAVPQGRRQPAQPQNSACFGRFALSRALPAWRGTGRATATLHHPLRRRAAAPRLGRAPSWRHRPVRIAH